MAASEDMPKFESGSEYGDQNLEQPRVQLVFGGIPIDITSSARLNTDRIAELQDIATDMTMVDEADVSTPLGTVSFTESYDISIQYDPGSKRILVSGPNRLFTQGDALVYTAEYLATCLRAAEQGTFLVHSAAVYDNDAEASYVFFGEKGAGKTTLALRLCHEQGMGLIGNDQIYLGSHGGKVVTEGGNDWFNVRQTAIKSDPYLASLVETKLRDPRKPVWNDKTIIRPEMLGVSVQRDRAPVQEIFHIRIDPTQDDLYTNRWEGVPANLFLHEKLGRHITGQATPFQDDKGNYIGTLPLVHIENSTAKRSELVGLIINQGITELFTPDSATAVEYIMNGRAQ